MRDGEGLEELDRIAREIRGRVVEMSHRAKTPHLGSALSCVDILVAVYWATLRIDPRNPRDRERDRFILSKGHAVSALYAALAYRGFFPVAQLETFNEAGSALAEQPSPACVAGLELATGSLGHGLSVGLGMAFAGRLAGLRHRVVVLMSDGECNEGSVWEAALLGASLKLGQVATIVDYNKWQATGRSNEIMALAPLREKWEAFGWSAYEVDGHDLKALVQVLDNVPDGSGKPVAVVAHTVKGKGVSFMEDDNNWHYRSPTAEEVRQARIELDLA
ncbi:MAG: transketolase [Elusimicrobia bacterium GWA2_69_24]|nr:MAG: transketolase [Candidatus Rokubacteria bacterium RBG_16_73_20]OGR60861.1 MAG: transketolase [Elusimicrobia bacterium GWA2_69_24]HBH00804.1 transketolase [Candidatus Rokubacteria bacterium]